MDEAKKTALTESYQVTAPASFDFNMSLGERIGQLAKGDPDLTAFIFRAPGKPRVKLTRKELNDRARVFGSCLITRGVKPGDKIAVLVTLGANWVIVQFGLYLVGATAVNSMAFDLDELRRLAVKFGCKGIIYDSSLNGQHEMILTFINEDEHNDISHNVSEGLSEHSSQYLDVPFPTISPTSEALICHTSGSTGEPKAVVHTHLTLLWGSVGFIDLVGATTNDLLAVDRPMVWMGGYPFFYLGAGIPMLYVTNPLDTDAHDEFYVDVLSEEKATQALILEYRIKGLQSKPHLMDKLPRLSSSLIGGHIIAKKSIDFLLEVSETVKIVYGTTECNDVIVHVTNSLNDVEDGTVGFLSRGSEIKLINSEGNIVPVGTEGELCFRSKGCVTEYILPDGRRGNTLDKNGWYHTGDIAIFRKDGLVRILGRKTEMIKRATVKIFPTLVEIKIKEIKDVQDVVVVGIPDDRLFEEVCAFIILKSNSKLQLEGVKQKAMDIFKPSSFPDGLGLMPGHFFIVDDFPRTSVSSKLNRSMLTKRALELLSTN